jgi:hypothetical protein
VNGASYSPESERRAAADIRLSNPDAIHSINRIEYHQEYYASAMHSMGNVIARGNLPRRKYFVMRMAREK